VGFSLGNKARKIFRLKDGDSPAQWDECVLLCGFDTLKALKETGISILLLEQNVYLAFALSDYAYVMAQGSFSPKASLPYWLSGAIFVKRTSDSSVATDPIGGRQGTANR
jgi:hypothetical protein